MTEAPPVARRPCWPWAGVAVGYLIPAAVGLGVWYRLRATGSTTPPPLPAATLVSAIPTVAIVSAFWALPYVAVAVAARAVSLALWRWRLAVVGGFIGTAVGQVILFRQLWTDAGTTLGMFFFWIGPVVSYTVIGGVAGLITGWLVDRRPRR